MDLFSDTSSILVSSTNEKHVREDVFFLLRYILLYDIISLKQMNRMEEYNLDWLDYREKLGIGFNNENNTNMFTKNIITLLKKVNEDRFEILDEEEYFRFCTMTATACQDYDNNEHIINEFCNRSKNFLEFIAYYVALINSMNENIVCLYAKEDYISYAEKFLKEAHIPFEILYDENNDYFIFPKGAKELDNALVSEPLDWLESYPKAHKTFCNALKQYSEGIYIRDVADNLRKALEEFLQEFLVNEKNLESNKDEICRYLGKQGIDSGISGLYQPLINSYKNINDRIAKHHDKIDEKLLEFLLYQTGVLIRMTITVKNAEK